MNPTEVNAVSKWREDPPSWVEGGRDVEVKYEGELIRHGKLDLIDQFFDGEDEWPVYGLLLEDGTVESFYDFEKWRFT